jgi:hypothetical protein
MKDNDAMKRLVIANKDMASQKYTIADVISNPNFVLDRVTDYLRSILYHNLAKVDVLYRLALKVQVLDERVDRDRLFQAVEYRHDCIHRNGMSKDGKRQTAFTKAYIREVADHMCALVDRPATRSDGMNNTSARASKMAQHKEIGHANGKDQVF